MTYFLFLYTERKTHWSRSAGGRQATCSFKSFIEMYIVCINSCIFAVVLRAYPSRILPTGRPKNAFLEHFGCVRFLYNLALETKSTAYAGNKISLSYNELSAQLTDLKKECEWLREVNSQCLQMALRNLNSFQNFFKGRASFPNFKKKTNKQSFQLPQSVKVRSKITALIYQNSNYP